MKKLLLIRHAEAESNAANGDFERPLSAKGKADVMQLAQRLKIENLLPQYIMSSPALRTTQTAGILVQELQLPLPHFNPDIYEASEKSLLQAVNHLPDSADLAALIGHNPGLSYLLLNLTGKVRDVPPCTAVVVVFEDADYWQEVSHDSGVITYYSTPQYH
jgi:phosphohistidine phosphatase